MMRTKCVVTALIVVLCCVLVAQTEQKASANSAGTGNVESAPPAPGYSSREEIVEAIRSGKLKTIKPLEEMPEGVQLTRDIEYGKVGQRALKLDVYKPDKSGKPVPGLIFIHGGAWKGGNKDIYRIHAARYAQRGYVAVSISYRLSGEAPFPAAVQDAKCAVRWMRANADKYGVDPNHICVLGGSAGGHLAMMVGYSWDDKELEGTGGHQHISSRVQAVVSIYGPSNLDVPFMRQAEAVQQFLANKKYDEAPDLYKKASPISYLGKDDPPTLILHGTLDALVPISQSDKLAERLRQVGVSFTYDRLEGWPHVMDIAEPVYKRCVFLIDRFLTEHMPAP